LVSGRFHNELRAIIDGIDTSDISLAEFSDKIRMLSRDWNVSPSLSFL